METNVDDAEIPPPNTSRNQIAMMYLASERRNKELEDQLEKANETNEKMQRRAAAFKSKKQVVQNAIGDILQSFNAVLTNHTEKRKVFSNRQLHIIFRDVENKVDPTVSALIKASPPTAEILKKLMEKPERKPKGTMLCRICQEPLTAPIERYYAFICPVRLVFWNKTKLNFLRGAKLLCEHFFL